MDEIREIRFVDSNPFEPLEECTECNSDLLAVETSGPLTDWIECGGCGLWFPPRV